MSAPAANKLTVILGGAPLYRMRERFEEAGIPGAYLDPEGQTLRRYIRCLEEVDVATEDGLESLRKLWGTVLHGAKILIDVDEEGAPEADTEVARHIGAMREQAQFVWD